MDSLEDRTSYSLTPHSLLNSIGQYCQTDLFETKGFLVHPESLVSLQNKHWLHSCLLLVCGNQVLQESFQEKERRWPVLNKMLIDQSSVLHRTSWDLSRGRNSCARLLKLVSVWCLRGRILCRCGRWFLRCFRFQLFRCRIRCGCQFVWCHGSPVSLHLWIRCIGKVKNGAILTRCFVLRFSIDLVLFILLEWDVFLKYISGQCRF